MTLQEQQQREMMANEVRRFEMFGNTPGYQGITPEQYAQFTQALGVQGAGAGSQTQLVVSGLNAPAPKIGLESATVQPVQQQSNGQMNYAGGSKNFDMTGGLSSVQSGGLTPQQAQHLSGGMTNDPAALNAQNASLGTVPPEILAQFQQTLKNNPSLRIGTEGAAGMLYQADPGASAGDWQMTLDPNTGQPLITKKISSKTWGQDVAGVYGMDGKGVGVSSGDSTALGLAKFGLASVGAYYGTNYLNGLGAPAAQAGTGVGASAGGAGGSSIGGLNGIEFGAGLESGATLTGGSTLTSGGTSAFGTTLADATIGVGGGGALGSSLAGGTYTGFMPSVGGGASSLFSVGGSPTVPSTPNAPGNNGSSPTPTTPPGGNKPGGSTPNFSNLSGWEQLLTLGAGLGASALGANALSNPVDVSRFNALFDGLLAEQAKVSARGDAQWSDYMNTWRPVEQKFANQAGGEVATQFDQQRQQFTEEATRYGMDPTTIAALGNASRLEEAKATAGAKNTARNNVEMQGLGLLQSGAQFGRNMPATANQSSSIATGTASSAAGVLNTQAGLQNQNTANRNALFGDLLGGLAGLYGMYTSERKAKKVGGQVDGLAAIDAVMRSPSSRWSYKEGQGDGSTQPRMGPMADDLAKVAPQVSDGKQVDAISMLGLHHAAIGELARAVRTLTQGQDGVYALEA
jgi:hypothetical protein